MCLWGYPKNETSYSSPVASAGSSSAAGYLWIPSLRKVTQIILFAVFIIFSCVSFDIASLIIVSVILILYYLSLLLSTGLSFSYLDQSVKVERFCKSCT